MAETEGDPLLRRRRWRLSFALFFMLAGAWSLTAPLFSAPDEPAHVIKAAGAVRGQLVGRASALPTVGVMRVPVGIASANEVPGCFAFKSDVSAACAPAVRNGYSISHAPTTANLYPPVYYLLIGWPSLLAPSAVSVYLMRTVNAALCAALIASAVRSAMSFRHPRPMLLAVALATTPMVVFLSGAVNPSAVEISSAICLWVSGALLVSEPVIAERGRVLNRIGIAAAMLASMRWFSPVFLGIIALTLAALASRSTLAGLVRDRRAWIWSSVVAASTLLTLGWTMVEGGSQQSTSQEGTHIALGTVLRGVIGRQDFNVRQMIGFFGWLDTPSPSLTYDLWFLLVGFLFIVALIYSRGRLRRVMVAMTLVTAILPIAIETKFFPAQGYFWQGRYTLPLAVGVVILAGLAVSRDSAAAAMLSRAPGPIITALSAAHGLAYLAFAQRFSVGKRGPLNFLSGPHWSPPVPFLVLVPVALVAGVAYNGWLISWALGHHDSRTGSSSKLSVCTGEEEVATC